MSKFLTFYSLFPIPDPKEFLGLATDKEEGNVLTTLGRNIVVILNISTQKQIRSWSIPEKLSAKVIYDFKSKKYVGVCENYALRLWDTDTVDITKTKKFKFKKSISNLVATEADTFILYTDGSVQDLETALLSRKDQIENSNDQLAKFATRIICDPSLHTLENGEKMITYFEKNNDTGELQLIRRYLNGKTSRYTIKRNKERCIGYVIIKDDAKPQLLTIWSDKYIYIQNLISKDRPPGDFVSILSELNVENELSLHCISPNFIAIYGTSDGQEGASLLIYNTQFKIVNARQYFKVHINVSYLWSNNESIVLAMGKNITFVNYRTNRDLLVDMLGSQTVENNLSQIHLDLINEEEYLENALTCADSSLTRNFPTDIKQRHSDAPLPPNNDLTLAYESDALFNTELDDLIAMHMHGETISCSKTLDKVNILLMTNFFDQGLWNTSAQSLMGHLELSGLSEQEIVENLLTLFIKTQDKQHFLMALRRYTNISEYMLVYALRFSLDNSNLQVYNNENSGDNENGDIIKEENELLNAVLACSFELTAIDVHLRKRLNISHVHQLLEYLLTTISQRQVKFEERPSYTSPVARSELQILKWAAALLTSHFAVLTVSKNQRIYNLLCEWINFLESYTQIFVDFQVVLPVYRQILQKRERKTKYNSKWYNIEQVVLY